MSDRLCPFNQQPCGCDPNATSESARPCKRSERAAKLVRMLGSTFESEQLSALRRLGEFLQGEGLTFSDFGAAVENKQFTIADAREAYERGKQKGLAEGARKQEESTYFDINGEPLWYEIACYCEQNSGSNKLTDWEREFISDMPSKMIRYGRPTEKQEKFLIAIFVKLGGVYVRKATHLHS
jgi:hypothetical protein